jgi:hypothetical protein
MFLILFPTEEEPRKVKTPKHAKHEEGAEDDIILSPPSTPRGKPGKAIKEEAEEVATPAAKKSKRLEAKDSHHADAEPAAAESPLPRLKVKKAATESEPATPDALPKLKIKKTPARASPEPQETETAPGPKRGAKSRKEADVDDGTESSPTPASGSKKKSKGGEPQSQDVETPASKGRKSHTDVADSDVPVVATPVASGKKKSKAAELREGEDMVCLLVKMHPFKVPLRLRSMRFPSKVSFNNIF